MFGFCSVLVLLDSLQISEGVQLDGRNLFIGFSAAISGPLGAAITATLAGITRVYIGGIGVISALISMAICALAGLLWRVLNDRDLLPKTWRWLVLGIFLCFSIPTLLLLPTPLGWQALTQVWLLQVVIYVVGTTLIGLALEYEDKFDTVYQGLTSEAELDPLTGALNRRGLAKRFRSLEAKQKASYTCLIAVLDIDNFKLLNDQYGHKVGDQALLQVVEKIQRNTRSEDLTARLGGDEFAVFVFGLGNDQASGLQAKLMRIMAEEMQITLQDGVTQVPFTATVGSIFYDKDIPNLNDMLAEADEVMMQTKVTSKQKNGRP